MGNYKYIGAIKYQNQWRIFGDNTTRTMWGITFLGVPLEEIPQKRKKQPIVNQSNVQSYMDALQSEITPEQIANEPSERYITFVVNFDEKVFVDGGGEDAMYLSITHLIPSGWQYIVDNPTFYVPEKISYLWLTKKADDPNKDILVSAHTSIGGVNYHRRWRFFIGYPETWILDLVPFMNASNRPRWPVDKSYDNWRKDLPLVDETNANLFISKLAEYELSLSEISKLRYALSEEDEFQLEVTKSSLLNITDSIKRKNIEALVAVWSKPTLFALIDFDERTIVQPSGSQTSTLSKVNPATIFAPSHWTCYLGNPIKYLPEDMQQWWQ